MKIAQKTRHPAALRGCDLKSEPGSIPHLKKETRKRHNREPVAICLALAVGHTSDGAPRVTKMLRVEYKRLVLVILCLVYIMLLFPFSMHFAPIVS